MRKYSLLHRVCCAVLAVAAVAPSVSAAMKSVELWGAWSVNDKGSSDNRITMDELQEDYSGYLQTDGMTEFFHKDVSPSPKIDMTEALAWLIDNDIISRDSVVTITNTNGVPDVAISKSDINTLLFNHVTRSDAIMYIYKSVFGPIDGRTIGVETPSVRSDKGSLHLYSDLFEKYSTYVEDDDIAEESTPGRPGDKGASGASGGDGGAGSTTQTNVGGYWVPWEYTPQGDEYTSMWGDTNVFISENHFNQDATGGDGGDGGDGINSGIGSASGGDGGGGGDASNTINYETDYKQIYFVPAADVLFYRTSDVIEVYLQAALSKGIFTQDPAANSAKFYDTFEPLTVDGASIAAWSGDADPYIVNPSKLEHVRVESVAYANVDDILGENYTVTYSGDTVNIKRDPLFTSNTGYFETEQLSRMDFYRYIYLMTSANEKKMTSLEADIVMYKYGLDLSYITTEADRTAIEFLIAKGIINYDGSGELENLYSYITWEEAIPVLYRVANKEARLDFSQIQLTDSEVAWRAKGFFPQSSHLTPEGYVGETTFEYTDEHYVTAPAKDLTLFADPLGWIADGFRYLVSPPVVYADDAVAGTSQYVVQQSGAVTFCGYHFDFRGAAYDDTELLSRFKDAVSQLDTCTIDQLKAQSSAGIMLNNPKHLIVAYFTKNIYVISKIQQDQQFYDEMCKVLDEYKLVLEKQETSELQRMRLAIAGYLRQHVDAAKQKNGTPYNITFVLDGVETNTANPGGNLVDFAESLSEIKFDMGNTSNSAADSYSFKFVEGTAATFIGDDTNVDTIVRAVNSSAAALEDAVNISELESAGSIENITSSFSSKIGTSLDENALGLLLGVSDEMVSTLDSLASTFTQMTNPEDDSAFISWTELSKLIKASNGGIPIVRISDNLLLNTETNTYAYFNDSSNGGKGIALVGAAVVVGNEDLGVVFKSGEGEAATIYYHLDAIRLLVNATQEETIISGRKSFSLASKGLTNSLQTVPLVSSSGITEDSMNGIYALISRDANADKGNFPDDSAFGQSYFVSNFAWARYFSLAQSNRASNIIYRRMQFTYNDRPINAFAVVRFTPIDVKDLGAANVSDDISLQEMLDLLAAPPTNSASKETWAGNKAACNAYANWVYGTSGETYVETGYLQPEASLYILGDASKAAPPDALYGNLADEYKAKIHIVSMYEAHAGVMLPPDAKPTSDDALNVLNLTSYWLSADAHALVNGDRLYLHEYLYDGVVIRQNADGLYAQTINTVVSPASFSLGSTFKAKEGATGTNSNPEIKVIATSSDGMVTAQVGPLTGFAVNTGSTKALVPSSLINSSKKISELDLYSNTGDNLLKTVYYDLFKYCSSMEYVGICSNPVRSSMYATVFDGENVISYDSSTAEVEASIALPKIEANETCSDFVNRTREQYRSAGMVCAATTCYLEVRFPACDYRVIDGVLKTEIAMATDFISPTLFVSLNDLIIDSMINESNGAIDLNDVPEGSIVKIGGTWYAATKNDEGQTEFVGYAHLQTYTGKPTIQDAALSFATHFIRVGNQYSNVSHFFKDFNLITVKSSADTDALNIVVSETFSLGDTAKYSVNSVGDTEVIKTSDEAFGGAIYTPVKFSCFDGLMAYPVMTSEQGVSRYNLCNVAKGTATGIFSELSFFSDSVLDTTLYMATVGLSTTSFQKNSQASAFTDFFIKEFESAFTGDLVTLLRFLIFVVLVWIMLASWVIYICRICNLQPFFEMIRYPSGERSSKGVDLFKIVSLGTISLDSEFGFTRFALYNLVLMSLASIIVIAW